MLSRRNFFLIGGLSVGACLASRRLFPSSDHLAALAHSFTELEKHCNGRLGVAVLDVRSGEKIGHRAHERFAMCSTFKMLLAAAVLQRVDENNDSLDRKIAIPPARFLANSPITQGYAGEAMSVRDLCAAIVIRSDNSAANLLLNSIGGPGEITRFARSIGDEVTRLDRMELALNEATPGDPRDTTSPEAMVADWRNLLLGNVLSPSSRKMLTDWLTANKTGDERLRKGLEPKWMVGDKTGSNGENTTNDVAIVWPGTGRPVLIAAYLTACPGPEAKRNDVIASVGRLVAKSIQ